MGRNLPKLLLVLLAVVGVLGLDVDIQNHWIGGFNGQITIPITQELHSWKIHIIFDLPVLNLTSPETAITKLNDREFIMSNQAFNNFLSPGFSLNVNFKGAVHGDHHLHACVYMEGIDEGACTHPQASITPPSTGSNLVTVCYTVTAPVSMYTNPATPAATTPATAAPTGTTGTPEPTPAVTTSGTAAPTPAVTTSGTAAPTVPPAVTTSGTAAPTQAPTGSITTATPGVTTAGPYKKPYEDALAKSILFYDAQRSGKLPADNPISWRADSALNDCVVGGWYDAGDHVKFGLPFGATTHLLLWGMNDFKDGYTHSGQLDKGYDMVKWATDYMLNAWNSTTQELVAQIGDGNADHSFWGRAEDMTMNRPCYKLGPGKPGADVAGEWAASLAAASLVFADKDMAYATRLITAAKELYAFAKANPGTYSSSIPEAGQFYASSGYKDEMCEGGVWLYRATGDPQYLADAEANHEAGSPWALSWDDKQAACQLLLYEETNNDQYKNEVQAFLSDWLPGGTVAYTPCGLVWRDKWGANRYAANVAFLALAAAEAGINTDVYRQWGVEQINYLLGDNSHDGGCFSYEIGVGAKSPKSPHHRSASCPDIPQPCSDANLHASGPSPHLLQGALVGGPDMEDRYTDNREDYVMNEVALDYNSGYQSALAAVNHLIATNAMPTTNNACACTG